MFEYKVVDAGLASSHDALETVLNQYAAQGWTFVAVSSILSAKWVIFSRPVKT